MLEIQGNNGEWTVKTEWLIDQRVVLVEYIGDFDAAGVIELNQFVADNYISIGVGPVHNIIDANQLGSFPKSLSVLRESAKYSVEHPNAGWNILLGFSANPILKFLSSAVSQLVGVKFKQVDTLEDAKEVLRRIDSTLFEIA